VVVVLGFEQKYWQIDGFGEKKAGISGFACPYSPPSFSLYLVDTILTTVILTASSY